MTVAPGAVLAPLHSTMIAVTQPGIANSSRVYEQTGGPPFGLEPIRPG